MFISQLHLDPRSRTVQRDISNIYDLHRRIMRAFPEETDRQTASVLFRLESVSDPLTSGIPLLVQSMTKPDWRKTYSAEDKVSLLVSPVPVKEIDTSGGIRGQFRFLLRANPAKRDSASQRIIPLRDEGSQIKWLSEHGEKHGFRFDESSLMIRKLPPTIISKKTDQRKMMISLEAVDYSGILLVTDEEKFIPVWQNGIGRGRAFGCGLLSLARI